MSDNSASEIKKFQDKYHLPWNQWLKRGTFIVFSVVFLIVTYFFLKTIYEEKISVESVLSVVLALFSMSVSAFFYFKADEAGKKFYNSSYRFMKKQSQLLGEINVKFSEKIDNMSTNIKDLKIQREIIEKEKDKNDEDIQDDKNKIIENYENQIKIYKDKILEMEEIIKEKTLSEKESVVLKKIIGEMKKNESNNEDIIKSLKRNLKNSYDRQKEIENKFEEINKEQQYFKKIEAVKNLNKVIYKEIPIPIFLTKEIASKILENGNIDLEHILFENFFDLKLCDEFGDINNRGVAFLKKFLFSM